MAQRKDTRNFRGLLFQFMGTDDPMLNMLKWLCEQMMEVEVSNQIGAEKHEQSRERTSHRCGFRPRRLDTRMGTMYRKRQTPFLTLQSTGALTGIS